MKNKKQKPIRVESLKYHSNGKHLKELLNQEILVPFPSIRSVFFNYLSIISSCQECLYRTLLKTIKPL